MLNKRWLAALCVLCWIGLAGCATQDSNGNSTPAESEWQEGHGELPGQIGQIDTIWPQDGWMFEPIPSLLELTGYNNPSGVWFFYNGGGKLGYDISGGTMKAGDEISVSVSTPSGEVEVNREARIRLEAREAAGDTPTLIEEQSVTIATVQQKETLWTAKLPDEENKAYLLTIEILSEQGEVEDTMGSAIFVPAAEVNVSWEAVQQSYGTEEKADFVLFNAGPTVLTLGTYYSIEKWVGEKWLNVPFPDGTGFHDIGITLAPGQTYDDSVAISHLDSGLYRVVKNVHVQGIEQSIDLAAEFKVE